MEPVHRRHRTSCFNGTERKRRRIAQLFSDPGNEGFFWGEDQFSGAAAKKKGKKGATEQLRLGYYLVSRYTAMCTELSCLRCHLLLQVHIYIYILEIPWSWLILCTLLMLVLSANSEVHDQPQAKLGLESQSKPGIKLVYPEPRFKNLGGRNYFWLGLPLRFIYRGFDCGS